MDPRLIGVVEGGRRRDAVNAALSEISEGLRGLVPKVAGVSVGRRTHHDTFGPTIDWLLALGAERVIAPIEPSRSGERLVRECWNRPVSFEGELPEWTVRLQGDARDLVPGAYGLIVVDLLDSWRSRLRLIRPRVVVGVDARAVVILARGARLPEVRLRGPHRSPESRVRSRGRD